MLYYNYDRETFELIGEPKEARLDPVGGNPMLPANATFVAPMSTGIAEVAVFDEGDQTWSIQPDFRGVVYYDSDAMPTEIDTIGNTIPSDCTTEVPPENLQFYQLDQASKQWVPKPIQDIKDYKIDEAYGNCAVMMSELLGMYSPSEMDTWARMYDECTLYKIDGTIGELMAKKIAVDPVYNTADKLADMTVVEYNNYIDGKYSLEAQRSQHKLNIDSETNVMALMSYDTSVTL